MNHERRINELETENSHLKEQLMHAQSLTALGELVGTTTHEFNNILMSLNGYAKMGMRHRDHDKRDNCFEKILEASQRATQVVRSILGMAKNRTAKKEPAKLVDVVENSLLLLERELRKYNIAVEKDLEEVPEVFIQANQIQQVLMNLLINARQAMPERGRVLIKLSYNSPLELVELMVRDFGSGIPADKLGKIFDRFYSTKEGPDETGKGGSGLGLAMCKEIIEQHWGKIRLASEVGKGTAFTLCLPTLAKIERAKSA